MIATDKSQSQRLLACGVSADTADMCYDSGALSLMDYDSAVHERDSRRESYEVVPAWSLSALLDILPKELTGYRMTHSYEPFADFVMKCYAPYFINGYLKLYHNGKKYVVDYDWDGFLGQMPCADDPIEACVLAIELLAANGYDFGKNNQEEADDGND